MHPRVAPVRPSVAVFDFGGVLIDWNPRHLYRKLIPDTAEMENFLAQVTTARWHAAQDHGGDPVQATRTLQALHPGKEELIAAFYDRFDQMCEHAFRPMADLVGRQTFDRAIRSFSCSAVGALTFSLFGFSFSCAVGTAVNPRNSNPTMAQICFMKATSADRPVQGTVQTSGTYAVM